MDYQISMEDVLAAAQRLAPHLQTTPTRNYATLDTVIENGIQTWIKHDNHLPTNAFKVRNALSLMTTLTVEQRQRGVVAATRGNHGMGLAWAGQLLGVPVTICVPHGNNPEKNAAIKGYGATLIECGHDYDAAAAEAAMLVERSGMTLAHSTNNRMILAGAATATLELCQQVPQLDVIFVAVGGGSLANGAITVTKALWPNVKVYGVQAAGAAAAHDSWHAGRRVQTESAITIADGLATRSTYDATWPTLQQGLAGFYTVTEGQIAAATALMIQHTHNLVEPAGAAAFAGLLAMRAKFAGQRVAVFCCGGNIDAATLKLVLASPT
jgi:threonine dehydratase